MIYLNLDENGRVLSAAKHRTPPEGHPAVETLPEGNLYEYRYVDGAFVHDPLPEPDPVEPSPTLEDRVETLEKKVGVDMADMQEALNILGVTVNE